MKIRRGHLAGARRRRQGYLQASSKRWPAARGGAILDTRIGGIGIVNFAIPQRQQSVQRQSAGAERTRSESAAEGAPTAA